MRILLLGEYSNVHATLAKGLRQLGHDVTVASNGDFWKDYPRDIDLNRREGRLGGVRLMLRMRRELPKMRDYDIVQFINPMFLELKAERIEAVYEQLRRNGNKRFVLGAYGMDYYWVNTCCEEKPLRYSDFNIGSELRTNADALRERKDWLGTAKQRLNERMAREADAIVAGLYEYYVCYHPVFPGKTSFIPFGIELGETPEITTSAKLRLFIGINKTRSEYKGTDIMLRAAKDVEARYPDRVELKIAESVPFDEYKEMMKGSDAILDQLYSYTPSMNPLQAMSQGLICVGGGEPENYEILGETELKPIVNVEPEYESVVSALEWLVMHPERIAEMRRQSVEYVRKHHEMMKVAGGYEKLYEELLK